MSYNIRGTTINLTRGDTFIAAVSIINPETEEPYVPEDGDSIRFAMKKKYTDEEPLLVKDIPIDTQILTIESEDTKPFDFGEYVYDIQLTKADGYVCTFITKSIINLMEEVT